MRIGWLGKSLLTMGRNRSWVYSLTDGCTIIPLQGYPLKLKQSGEKELWDACNIATLGDGKKDIQSTVIPAPPFVNTDLTLTQPAFGVKIKYSNSMLSFNLGTFRFALLDTATLVSEVYVMPIRIPIEFVMLGISDTGGQASLKRIAAPVVRIIAANSAMSTGDSFSAETLNQRDLGSMQN